MHITKYIATAKVISAGLNISQLTRPQKIHLMTSAKTKGISGKKTLGTRDEQHPVERTG